MQIYIASSWQRIYTVRMLTKALEAQGHTVLDWTKSIPTIDGRVAIRKEWFNTYKSQKVFQFCAEACARVDLVIYLGQSGSNTGIELGIAYNAGVPIIGIKGLLKETDLMLNNVITEWIDYTELKQEKMQVSGL